MLNKKLRLFAGVFLVKGASRSLICDTQRSNIKFIPNNVYDVIVRADNFTISQLLEGITDAERALIIGHITFLIENEFGFCCEDTMRFPMMRLDWESPLQITNGIIDFDKNSNHNLEKLFYEYSFLGCKHLELRFFDEFSISYISQKLSLLENSRINAVNLVIKFSQEIRSSDITELFHSFPRLNSILVHSATDNRSISDTLGIKVRYFVQEISSSSHCGQISPEYFSISQDSFLESIHFNSCLNKKISIDVNGFIRNCPSMKTTYGNVLTASLIDAVDSPELKKLWLINKDMIEVCKDCEFRHICTDCRAFLGEDYSLKKPKKCSYDPYTMLWHD